MTYTCPNDPTHQSVNPDNCSICGARISMTPAAGPSEPIAVAAVGNSILVDAGSDAVLTPSSRGADEVISAGGPPQARTKLVLIAAVDPTLYIQPNRATPCPVGEPNKVFDLDKSENRIGRRSERRASFPEIALTDPGVSHKHAIILREHDGSLILMDVGSANGTQLNGKDVPSGVRIPLCGGDQIVIGCWTRMTLQTVEA